MSYLGLDIGGSKSRFEWWQDAVCEATQARRGGVGESVHPAVHADIASRLAGLLRQATGDGGAQPDAAVIAMAGGDAVLRSELPAQLAELGVAFPVAIVGDVLAAAAAGLREGPGLLLWSGTGSFAVARDSGGQLVRVGGRGYAFGDEGSGYDLVRRAIIAALHAIDGRGRQTVLVDLLTEAFEAPSPERLGAVAQRLSPREVGSRLPVLLEAFAQEDWVAADLLENGMRQLVDLGRAALKMARIDLPVIEKAGIEKARIEKARIEKAGIEKARDAAGPRLRVALGGGVLEHSELVRDGLTRMLQASFGGELRIESLPSAAAAHGAAWLAAGWHGKQAPQNHWVEDVAL